jgi:hypothetical protein
MRIVLGLLAVAALLSPPAARAQSSARLDAAAFDRADRRARELLRAIRCAQGVSMARARGEFGPPDSLGPFGQCIAVDSRMIGVFFDADSPYVAVKRFAAVDLGSHTRRTAPLDTSRVLALVRAEQAAYAHGAAEVFKKENRPFAPMAFRFEGDSIEVWLIPVTLFRGPAFTLGGERGYLFTPDGHSLVRETDATADFRPFVIPDSGTVRIVSRSTTPATLPSLSEMVLANRLNYADRDVAIEWGGVTSLLTGRGERAVWLQVTPTP